MEACQRESDVLIRARGRVTRTVVQCVPNGSCLVEIHLRNKKMLKIGRGKVLLVREIKGRVGRSHNDSNDITLWSNLHDFKNSPALRLRNAALV